MGNLTKDFKFDLQRFAEGDNGDGDKSGDVKPTWTSLLPDEYKNDEYGKGFKSIGEFYITHKGMRAKIDDMPKAPENEEGYEFTKPEGIEINPEVEKWFRKTALGLKMSKEMAGKLYQEYNSMAVGQVKTKVELDAKALTKADELMHGEWGENFDKNMKLVEKGIEDLGGEDLRKVLDDSGMGNHPAILKALKQVGFEHSEDTIREGVVTGTSKGHTLNDEYPSMKDLPGEG